MHTNEKNPIFFNRNSKENTNGPWLTYPDSPDRRNSGAIGIRGNGCTNLNMNFKNEHDLERWQKNSKPTASIVSPEKCDPFTDSPYYCPDYRDADLIVSSMPYSGEIQREPNVTQHQSSLKAWPQIRNNTKIHSQFNKKSLSSKKLYSVIENRDTDFEKCVKNVSDHTDKSLTEPTYHQAVDINFLRNDLYTEYNDSIEMSGDLDKLQSMTAIDLDRDRYARYRVHELEMKDYVRTVTFKNCLEYCAQKYIKNKVVLVIRCGIGLLPLLCVRDGQAKKVIALEQSACIEYARRIVKDNLYSHMITFIQSSVHDLKVLPHGLQRVDVIVSDFMGECVISQGDLMEQVIEARDRFLKPNGLMIPICVTLYSQLLEHRQAYKNKRIHKYLSTKHKINKKNMCKKKLDQSEIEAYDTDSSSDSTQCSWWSDVYGFDMRSKPEIIVDNNSKSKDFDKVEWCVMDEPLVAFFDPCKVVSTACLMKEFDMYKCTVAEVRLVQCKNLRFKCVTPYSNANGGDYAHMLELFMVVDFPNGQDLYDKNDEIQIGFSTSSYSPHSRYQQTGLLLRNQLLIVQGDEFIINEFHMWRGPQLNNPFENTSNNKSSCNNSLHEENLKLRLRYTFVNKFMKAIDRRCAYTLIKDLF